MRALAKLVYDVWQASQDGHQVVGMWLLFLAVMPG
jgi:hypothetical protein